MNRKLAAEINRMAAADQRMRRKGEKTGRWDRSLDRAHAIELKKIIKRFGWPTASAVGKKASFNAWLLVQHADHNRVFQKRVLRKLKDIYRRAKDIDPANIAFLTDRILVAEGKKQIFGTQFRRTKNGALTPYSVRDIRKLNERRKKFGLKPFGQIKSGE